MRRQRSRRRRRQHRNPSQGDSNLCHIRDNRRPGGRGDLQSAGPDSPDGRRSGVMAAGGRQRDILHHEPFRQLYACHRHASRHRESHLRRRGIRRLLHDGHRHHRETRRQQREAELPKRRGSNEAWRALSLTNDLANDEAATRRRREIDRSTECDRVGMKLAPPWRFRTSGVSRLSEPQAMFLWHDLHFGGDMRRSGRLRG